MASFCIEVINEKKNYIINRDQRKNHASNHFLKVKIQNEKKGNFPQNKV
jgi:hypothetical protein